MPTDVAFYARSGLPIWQGGITVSNGPKRSLFNHTGYASGVVTAGQIESSLTDRLDKPGVTVKTVT